MSSHSRQQEKAVNMNNEMRELSFEEVAVVEGAGTWDCNPNAWDKWIYTYFFANLDAEIH